MSPRMSRLQSTNATARLREAGPLDGIIQIGTGFIIETQASLATYEDITIPQALALGYPGWDSLSDGDIRARMQIQSRAYEVADACCVTTPWVGRSIVADYGVSAGKVCPVGVGRNHDPGRSPRDWRIPRFLFVGRDWEGKNGPRLLRAFARLRREHPRATLDVVGRHPPIEADGVTGHGFLSLADDGGREKLTELYRRATCFVLPSLREASAIAYVEAASAALPCIVTSAGGSPDLVGNGGVVVEPADELGILSAMRSMAKPEQAQRLGEIAARRAELLTWPLVAARLMEALGLGDRLARPVPPFPVLPLSSTGSS